MQTKLLDQKYFLINRSLKSHAQIDFKNWYPENKKFIKKFAFYKRKQKNYFLLQWEAIIQEKV